MIRPPTVWFTVLYAKRLGGNATLAGTQWNSEANTRHGEFVSWVLKSAAARSN
jgi:hypothetical protein